MNKKQKTNKQQRSKQNKRNHMKLAIYLFYFWFGCNSIKYHILTVYYTNTSFLSRFLCNLFVSNNKINNNFTTLCSDYQQQQKIYILSVIIWCPLFYFYFNFLSLTFQHALSLSLTIFLSVCLSLSISHSLCIPLSFILTDT